MVTFCFDFLISFFVPVAVTGPPPGVRVGDCVLQNVKFSKINFEERQVIFFA